MFALVVGIIFVILLIISIVFVIKVDAVANEDKRKAQEELNRRLERLSEKQKQTDESISRIEKQIEPPEVVEAVVINEPPQKRVKPQSVRNEPPPQKPTPKPQPKVEPKPKPKQQPKPKPKPQPNPAPIKVTEIQQSMFPLYETKGDDAVDILDTYNIYYIDRRFDSGIIWVPEDDIAKAPIKLIQELYTVKFESRGGIITCNRPAWRIMIR